MGNYIGRGYGPQFASADLKSATPRKTWTNPVIQSLQIIVKSIHALEKLRTKPQAYAQTCRVLKQIDDQLNTLPADKFEEDVAGFEDDELMHHVANIRHEHDSDLCDIRAGMENKLNRYKNLYYTEQRREVTEWALADPAGANIYAWLRKDLAAPQLMTQVQTPECRITTPLGLMEHRATIWEQLWHRNRASFPRIVEVLGELRRRAVQKIGDWDHIEPYQLDDAINTFKENTGLGLDEIKPRYLKWIPDQGKRQLLQQHHNWIHHLTMPWQLMCMVIGMLAKPTTGGRPICLEAFLLRLFMRLWFADYGATHTTASRTMPLQARRPYKHH